MMLRGRGRPAIDWSFLGASMPSGLSFARAGAATRFDASGVMRSMAAETPRFEYDPVTHEPLGLLMEAQRTNYVLQSADISVSPWGADGTGTRTSGVTAPDGTTTAARAVSASSDYIIRQDVTGGSAGTFTFSVWLKCHDGSNAIVRIGVSNKGGWTGSTNAFVTLTNQWQRFSVTGTVTTDGARIAIGGASSLSTGESVDVWGGQLEQASFASSYIPTTSASVTRAGDRLYSTSVPWLNLTQGTLMLDIMPILGTTGYPQPWTLSDGTVNNVLFNYINEPATKKLALKGYYGGANMFDYSSSSMLFTSGARSKITTRYKASEYAFTKDGIAPSGSSYANVPPFTRLDLMASPSGGNQTYGRLRAFKYWNRALANSELQRITT